MYVRSPLFLSSFYTCQVEAPQVLGAREGLQVAELIVTEVQVGEEGGSRQSLFRQVLKGHVVKVEVCKLRHGNGFFSEVDHGVVAQVQPCDLT